MTLRTSLLALCLVTACGSTVPLAGNRSLASDGLSAPSSASPASDSAQPGGGTSTGAGPSGAALGGGSGGSGPASTGSGTISGPALPGAGRTTSGAIPLTGKGWDAKHVYVGVPTANDFNAAVKGLGANFDNGSTQGDVDAVVADINRTGGVLGRQVVAVYHDTSTVALTSNPAAVSQSMCAYFTQDRPVVAVLNGAPQLDAQPSFHTCLEKAGVSLLSFTNTDYAASDYARLGPHLWSVASLSTDVLVPGFVDALHRQGFFSGWDTITGRAGTAPAKAGLLLPDSPQGHHAATLFTAALKRNGVPVASSFFYDPAGSGSASQSEVLQFQSAKVTHVLDLPPVAAEVYLFQGTAEQQHYRPRYGITSFNLPLGMEENGAFAPPGQQPGTMGIGWQPLNDTNASHDPGPAPGSKRCLTALNRGGQTFSASRRRAALVGVQFCDALYLLRDAMTDGKGFDGHALLSGMPLAGPRLLTAGTFASTLSASDHGVPGFYRDLRYDQGCTCFAYDGPRRPFA